MFPNTILSGSPEAKSARFGPSASRCAKVAFKLLVFAPGVLTTVARDLVNVVDLQLISIVLYVCGDMRDEMCGEKEKRVNE